MTLEDIIKVTNKEYLDQILTEFGVCKDSRQGHLRKREMLDPYEVGLMRLAEMHISKDSLDLGRIELIGRCSIERIWCIVAKIDRRWQVGRATKQNLRDCRHHGYLVKGKKVIPLYRDTKGLSFEMLMDAFERAEVGKTLCDMKADDIFRDCQGRRFKKKPGNGGSILPNGKLAGMGTNSQREREADNNKYVERRMRLMISK